MFGTRDVHLVLGGDNHIVSAAADGAFSDPGPCVTVWAVKIGASTIQAVARKPGFTTLSTSDQELVAVSGCVASVLAFRELAREFGMPQQDASKIGCDNNSVVLTDEKGEPIGTRIFGPVTRELRYRGQTKIISLAPEVL